MPVPPFQSGDTVRLRADAAHLGRVVDVIEDPQVGGWQLTVLIGDRRVTCFDDEVVPAATLPASPWDLLAEGVVGSARDLRTDLTWERLRRPPGRVGATFGSARATLYPYQFKPLVKFLDNPNHVLLVADEVGLGKTIEAAYILREWQERQVVQTVLIVVPARLRTKWRDELQKRFELTFDLVGARDVLRALRRGRDRDGLEPFRWIASYESLRQPEVVEMLQEDEPAFDFLVFDEAHRVRNPETHQHRLARALLEGGQAAVMLTATPVQTSLRDLHSLLDLLDPGGFGRADDFPEMVAANRPIVQAAVLAGRGRFAEAAAALGRLDQSWLTRDLAEDPAVKMLVEGLRARPNPDRATRVEYQAAIGDLSLTGHMLTRTRKADVLERRPVRDAQTVQVELLPEEEAAYRAVERATRVLYAHLGPLGHALAALMALRLTASSIQGGIAWMRDRLDKEGMAFARAALDAEVESALVDEVRDEAGRRAAECFGALVGDAFGDCPVPRRDSKLLALLDTLWELWAADDNARRAPRKVIVFAFFKRTLAYLSAQLEARGVVHVHIDGDVPIEDREERIDAFINDPSIRVLLSSEVGGEGLDLQAACVVVNYDLPWNPAVVEQRIGRVDRIGQNSDVIVIVNLACQGTVEDRIVARLYQRVDLFQGALGEMEDILGLRDVRDLIVRSLTGDLTPEQEAEMVEQTALAVERKLRDANALAGQVDELLAADQAILDQLHALVDGRRLPSPSDLVVLLTGFFDARFPGNRLDGDPVTGLAQLDLPPSARAAFDRWSREHEGVGRRLVALLNQGPVPVTADGDAAMKHPRAQFLQLRHPLVQFAVDSMTAEATGSSTSFAARVTSDALRPGPWIAGIWNLSHEDDDNDLCCVAVAMDGSALLAGPDAEPMLLALLDACEELDPRPILPAPAVRAVSQAVQQAFGRYLREEKRRAAERLERRRTRRRATWQASLLQGVRRAEARLAKVRASGKAFPIRMAEAQVRRKRAELARVQETTNAIGGETAALTATEIAVVLVVVLPGQGA